MLNVVKKYYFFLVTLLIGLFGFVIFKISMIYIMPYYNLMFTNYNYQYPKINEKFVVGKDGDPKDAQIPEFLINILKLAFYDRELVVDNNQPPNLIVRCENFKGYKEPCKYSAPYITLSAERWTLKRHKYRKNGPPLAEIVSTTPNKPRQLYFPFVARSGVVPKKIYSNIKQRRKFLAYIASNCVKKREQLFALIKNMNQDAQALGICSNPNKTRFPGGYDNLDEIYAQYNFGFAMENAQVPGYITEKIVNVFRGGAIPIYWGHTETVNKYFNPKAFINIDEFKNLQEAAKYIVNLSEDKIEAMKAEPMFVDDKIPEIFGIINDPEHPLLKEAAEFIRKEYFHILKRQ
jgi:Glycosyltransferase family 10 (fucosyltransferase) C-term